MDKDIELIKKVDSVLSTANNIEDREQREIIDQVYQICFYSGEKASDDVFNRIMSV